MSWTAHHTWFLWAWKLKIFSTTTILCMMKSFSTVKIFPRKSHCFRHRKSLSMFPVYVLSLVSWGIELFPIAEFPSTMTHLIIPCPGNIEFLVDTTHWWQFVSFKKCYISISCPSILSGINTVCAGQLCSNHLMSWPGHGAHHHTNMQFWVWVPIFWQYKTAGISGHWAARPLSHYVQSSKVACTTPNCLGLDHHWSWDEDWRCNTTTEQPWSPLHSYQIALCGKTQDESLQVNDRGAGGTSLAKGRVRG